MYVNRYTRHASEIRTKSKTSTARHLLRLFMGVGSEGSKEVQGVRGDQENGSGGPTGLYIHRRYRGKPL